MQRDLEVAARQLANRAGERWPLTLLAVLSIVFGIAAGFTGVALAALPILLGVGISALVDARLPMLLLILLLPGTSQFHGLPAFEIEGSVIGFRLLMTGGTGLLLMAQLTYLRPRWGIVGSLGVVFLVILVVLAPLNEYAPLRALAPIARFADYLLAFLVARRLFRAAGDGGLVVAALLLSFSIVAASAVIQFATGGALPMNDADRLTGTYVTSPVGLGMAMELGLLVLWVIVLRTGLRRPAAWLAGGLFVLFLLIMLETSSRLVFATLVAGLVLFELLRRRMIVAAGVVVVAVMILALHPQLAGRIVSTVGEHPSATPSPSSAGPPATAEDLPGDPSLRYRLYLWLVMLPEWAESPVVGRGTGSFAALFERQSGIPREAPHNDYVGLLVETGIVGLGTYLLLQLTTLAAAVLRWRIARAELARRLLAAAGLVYFVLSVLSILNNPILFLDLQVICWALLGVAFSMPRLAPGEAGRVSVVPVGRGGLLAITTDFTETIGIIWRDRPAELQSSGRASPGQALAAMIADVPLGLPRAG